MSQKSCIQGFGTMCHSRNEKRKRAFAPPYWATFRSQHGTECKNVPPNVNSRINTCIFANTSALFSLLSQESCWLNGALWCLVIRGINLSFLLYEMLEHKIKKKLNSPSCQFMADFNCSTEHKRWYFEYGGNQTKPVVHCKNTNHPTFLEISSFVK